MKLPLVVTGRKNRFLCYYNNTVAAQRNNCQFPNNWFNNLEISKKKSWQNHWPGVSIFGPDSTFTITF